MSLYDFFFGKKETSAEIAVKRLQILVARSGERETASPDFLPQLQREILAVVRQYYPISEEQIDVKLQTEGDCEVLGLSITLDQKTQQVEPRRAHREPLKVPLREPPRSTPRTSF